MLFVTGLTTTEQKLVKKSHEKIIRETGFYTEEEIEGFLSEIENEKFLNLEDALEPQVYKKIYKKYFPKK